MDMNLDRPHPLRRAMTAFVTAGAPAAAWAHAEHTSQTSWTALWNVTPDLLIGIGIFVWWYCAGLWRQRGRDHPRSLWKHTSFFVGLALLFVALASPLDALADRLFFIHQVQHLLLQTVGPMLIMLAAPQGLLVRGMPAAVRRGTLAPAMSSRGMRGLFSFLWHPWVAALLLVISMYVWQWPPYHDRSVLDPIVHYVMHLTMLGAGLLFYACLFDPRPPPAGPTYGTRIGIFLFTMTAGMLLGAWLALKDAPLYSAYDEIGRLWDLDALADERLGGLILWIPGSFVSVPALLVLIRMWSGREERLDGLRRRGFAASTPPTARADSRRLAYWLAFGVLTAFVGTIGAGLIGVSRSG